MFTIIALAILVVVVVVGVRATLKTYRPLEADEKRISAFCRRY